jgi:CRISPR-associated protein Csb2
MADYRVEKDVRPTFLDGEALHYVYLVAPDDRESAGHREVLVAAARSITHLGWGIDMVAADACFISRKEADKISGERWLPTDDPGAHGLRVPRRGTLDDLIRKHERFLNRLVCDAHGNESYIPVPPLTDFRVVGYRRATEPETREFAAFSILKPDASGFRSFDTPRRTRDVAGMVRSCVARLAKEMRPFGWSDEQINVFVHGKTPDGRHPAGGKSSPDRFMYLPLPTLNHALRRVESIRRVLIAAPPHCGDQIAWLRRAASGAELVDDHGGTAALLMILPRSDWVLRRYVEPSMNWATVTPVILPIHDGYDADTAARWLHTAFEQAGYAPELLSLTELDWRRVGFHAGVDLASRYLPPKNLENKPRFHVRVQFPHPIPGPLVVGSGRFRGFGLFATLDDQDQE